MAIKLYTAKELARKYRGKYIKVSKESSHSEDGEALYTLIKAYKDIHEDTTMAEDLEMASAYRR
jgi:hypothetical protein